ncbi:MAG: hypothetical protein FJ004_04020 [Chloroflexi bacterium]|nr:hypothetical protein [Chloroflexota bacterium]
MHSDLNDEADIQVANTKKEAYVIVLSEFKMDFSDDITVEVHSDITRQILLDSLENVIISDEPVELQINGRRALQYEISGRVEGINVVYLHTTVDGEEGFHQIIAWTLPSKYDKNKPLLDSVVNSFREIGN